MATKEKIHKWDDEDERIGNAFLSILNGYHGRTMSEKFRLYRNNAARALGYQLYNHLPEGAKKFISHLGGKKGGGKKKEEDISMETKEERWMREVDIHSLHPEDEDSTIQHLQQLRST